MEHPFKKNTLCVDVFSHAKKEDIHLLWINWVLWFVFNRKRRSHGALNWQKHRRQKPMISPVKLLKNPIQQNKKTIALKEGLERLGLNVDSNFQHNLVYTGCTYVLILVVPKPTWVLHWLPKPGCWLFLPIYNLLGTSGLPNSFRGTQSTWKMLRRDFFRNERTQYNSPKMILNVYLSNWSKWF